MITAERFPIAPHLKPLYQYLAQNRYIQSIRNFNRDLLAIRRRDLLARMQPGHSSWEEQVPPPIVEVIKQHRLFGCGAACPSADTTPVWLGPSAQDARSPRPGGPSRASDEPIVSWTAAVLCRFRFRPHTTA